MCRQHWTFSGFHTGMVGSSLRQGPATGCYLFPFSWQNKPQIYINYFKMFYGQYGEHKPTAFSIIWRFYFSPSQRNYSDVKSSHTISDLRFFFYASLTGIFIFSYLFIFNKWTNCEKGHSWLLYISFSDFPGPRILAMPVRNNKRKDSWV